MPKTRNNNLQETDCTVPYVRFLVPIGPNVTELANEIVTVQYSTVQK